MSGLTFLCWITSSSAFSFMPGRGRDATNTGRAPKSANPSLLLCHQRPASSQFLTSVISSMELISNAGLQVPRKHRVTEDLVEMQILIRWDQWFSVSNRLLGDAHTRVLHYTLRQALSVCSCPTLPPVDPLAQERFLFNSFIPVLSLAVLGLCCCTDFPLERGLLSLQCAGFLWLLWRRSTSSRAQAQ